MALLLSPLYLNTLINELTDREAIMKRIPQQFTLPIVLSTTLLLGACTADQINAGIGIAGHALKGATTTNAQIAQKASLSAQVLDKKHKVAGPNSRYTKRLNRLTRSLRTYNGMNFNYKVYLSNQVNAFAMPDGTVRVYSKLMDIMNDDELLAVIGHEIGHVELRHSLSQYKKAYLAKAAQMGLQAYGGKTVGALAGSYGDIGRQYLGARFSRNDELAADEYGVKLLHRLGRNPYAAVDAQKKLQKLGGGQGGLFASHPSSAERINRTIAAAGSIKK